MSPLDADRAASSSTQVRLGVNRLLRASIMPMNRSIDQTRPNVMGSWSLRIERIGKGPVERAVIDFDGGMPMHDHGFPTAPRVTKELGNGTYLLEGVRFNMPGWWQFVFCIEAGDIQDVVRFDIMVEPSVVASTDNGGPWTHAELEILDSLRLDASHHPGPEPSSQFAANEKAARLGQRLFFDTILSRTETFSCASCHDPAAYFTDTEARSRALGDTRRHAPSLIGVAYAPWLYWDGSKDSLWAQALVPIERRNELGLARVDAVRRVTSDSEYAAAYATVFGESADLSDRSRFPEGATPVGSEEQIEAWQAMSLADRDLVNRVFSNMGKALGAYERRLLPTRSRFDRYVDGLLAEGAATDLDQDGGAEDQLNAAEIAGLRLFISKKAQCLRCHNGPLFSNFGFHNTGVPQSDPDDPDFGRAAGVEEALVDEFNCLGPYSDAVPEQCLELEFVKREGEELVGAFKVPSLRNVAETAPYMHGGQYATLREVLEHYSRPPVRNIGHLELSALNLTDSEIDSLEAFLRTLTSEAALDPEWLSPPSSR